MPIGEKDLTYRVSGLPVGVSTRDAARILSSLFDNDGQITGPTVHSLGLDPHRFGRTVTRVATVTFAQTPRALDAGHQQWNFTAHARAYRPDDDALFPIMIDTHFLGFTPLNIVKDDEEHKVEYGPLVAKSTYCIHR